jgi:hypothetical protein
MRQDVERYLDAIRGYAPDHATVTDAECWSTDAGAERWIYVNDPPRDAVAMGEAYFTFIVCVDAATERILRVIHYRSRKGAHGDETLPP